MGHHGKRKRRAPAPQAPPERRQLDIGFVPLADCAPLVVARERGFFADEGLDVHLSREASWAAIRDKVALGLLDGAQMLAGMPLASTLGIGTTPQPMITALSLSLNGNAITVSDALYRRMQAVDPGAAMQRPVTASALRQVIADDRAAGLAPLTFAMVHPVSSHNYQLRYWLAAGGIDPDRDVRIIVVPPPRMVANLEAGRIAGYCVGAPWNQVAVEAGLGHIVISGYELWNNAPEKVFGVTRAWADRHPRTHRALLRALVRACAWLDEPGNRDEIAPVVAVSDHVGGDANLLRNIYAGNIRYHPGGEFQPQPDHCVFHRYAANFPWRSHALWFLSQMVRWRQLHPDADLRGVAEAVYRPELYREIAATLELAAPAADTKTEGRHRNGWTLGTGSAAIDMGPDRFFDGNTFDVASVAGYLRPRSAGEWPALGTSQ